MPRPRVSKRLDGLIKSGICSAEDASERAEELRQLAQQEGGGLSKQTEQGLQGFG